MAQDETVNFISEAFDVPPETLSEPHPIREYVRDQEAAQAKLMTEMTADFVRQFEEDGNQN